MVTIIDYAKRVNSTGEEFLALILQGGIEMVKSQETGRFYATAKRASITSTFNEDACKALIGQKLPGSIRRIDCELYEFTVRDTGEVLNLSHRWEYTPEAASMEETVFEGEVIGAEE